MHVYHATLRKGLEEEVEVEEEVEDGDIHLEEAMDTLTWVTTTTIIRIVIIHTPTTITIACV